MATESQTELMLFQVETTQHNDGTSTQKVKKIVRECSVTKAAAILQVSADSVRRLYHAGIIAGWQPLKELAEKNKQGKKTPTNAKIVLDWDSVIAYREKEKLAQQMLRERE
eukprot:Seg16597.2 transcript_id=Seg16597.2/GoldUCD/mRNA.D3Y31 product="hypothetical protein" protein_id=Seg16597.2/GoldUCD/D3Y31